MHEEKQRFTARVRYRKAGLTRFIGHLDTVRVLLRAVRRAGIEGVYSQGFSPRLRLSFSPPLPLGCTSECEFFDIRLARSQQPDSIRHSLRSHVPDGLYVEEVQVVEGDITALAKAFWAAEYEVEVPHECRMNTDVVERLSGGALSAGALRNQGDSDTSPTSRLVRARWHDRDDGTRMLSVVLRQDAAGKGGLKETLGAILGIPRETVEKCRIHKKKVYGRGERAER
jgi:radical SAM-linked protein